MSKPIVFLSGPDRCGKTNIAKSLAENLGVKVYKASSERDAFISSQDRFVMDIKFSCPARLDLLKQLGVGVVYDRGYPCEWVYSKFFNRKTDTDAIFWLDEQYAKLGAVVIVPYRTSYEGIRDDLDPTIDAGKLRQLDELYQEFLMLTKCRSLRLNVDDENLPREINDILNFMSDKENK